MVSIAVVLVSDRATGSRSQLPKDLTSNLFDFEQRDLVSRKRFALLSKQVQALSMFHDSTVPLNSAAEITLSFIDLEWIALVVWSTRRTEWNFQLSGMLAS